MTLFFILAGLLVLQGLASLLEGFRYLAFIRRSLGEPIGEFAPKATVILPCKGVDAGLDENLRALCRQDYPAYELLLVVASDKDTALPVLLQTLKAEEGVARSAPARVLIAGQGGGRSEKVNNLLHAVAQASDESEVFIFADSDARMRRNWLRSLVAPLADRRVGASTGYRWYLPASPPGLTSRRFIAALLSAWNGSVATTLGDHGNNFAWGGSTAILKATFEEVRVREAWQGAVSDDYALTRAVRKAGKRITFSPRCMAVTSEDSSLASLLEFTTRQVIITRVYHPGLWWIGIISQLFFTTVFFGGVLLASLRAADGQPVSAVVALLAVIYGLGSAKGLVRLLAARQVVPDEKRDIDRLWWMYCLLWILVSLVYLYNFIGSATTRRILWRGTLYEMRSPEETVVLSPLPTACETPPHEGGGTRSP